MYIILVYSLVKQTYDKYIHMKIKQIMNAYLHFQLEKKSKSRLE